MQSFWEGDCVNSFLMGLISFFGEFVRTSKVSSSSLNPEKCLSRTLLFNFLRHRPKCIDPFSSSTFTISKSSSFSLGFTLARKGRIIFSGSTFLLILCGFDGVSGASMVILGVMISGGWLIAVTLPIE